MPDRSRTLVGVALCLLLLIGQAVRSRPRPAQSVASGPLGAASITPAERRATFTFAPDVQPYDRQVFLQAVAGARPEARRLIDLVDGLVTVHVAATGAGTVGLTHLEGHHFDVTVDLGTVAQRYGQRGIDRDVLHELGHVVDFALVPPALDAELDARTPAGYGCDQGLSGGCASRRERFAESFAKWATRDIGVDLDLGYKVPPPDSLEDWGAPLSRLGT